MATKEGFQGVENHNLEKNKNDSNADKKIHQIPGSKPFFNITKLKIMHRSSQNYSRKILRKCQGNFNLKLYQTETKKTNSY